MARNCDASVTVCTYHRQQLGSVDIHVPWSDRLSGREDHHVVDLCDEDVDSFWSGKAHTLLQRREESDGQNIGGMQNIQGKEYFDKIQHLSSMSSVYKVYPVIQISSNLGYTPVGKDVAHCGCFQNSCNKCTKLPIGERLQSQYQTRQTVLSTCHQCRCHNVAANISTRLPLYKELQYKFVDFQQRRLLHEYIRSGGLPEYSIPSGPQEPSEFLDAVPQSASGASRSWLEPYIAKEDGVFQAYFLYPRKYDLDRKVTLPVYMHLVPLYPDKQWIQNVNEVKSLAVVDKHIIETPPAYSEEDTKTKDRIPSLQSLMLAYTTRRTHFKSKIHAVDHFQWSPEHVKDQQSTEHVYPTVSAFTETHVCSKYGSGDCVGECSGVHGVKQKKSLHQKYKVLHDSDTAFYKTVSSENKTWWEWTRAASTQAIRQEVYTQMQDELVSEQTDVDEPMLAVQTPSIAPVLAANKEFHHRNIVEYLPRQTTLRMQYVYSRGGYVRDHGLPLQMLLPYQQALSVDTQCLLQDKVPCFDAHIYSGLWLRYNMKRFPKEPPLHCMSGLVLDPKDPQYFPYKEAARLRFTTQSEKTQLLRTRVSEELVKNTKRVKTVKEIGTIGIFDTPPKPQAKPVKQTSISNAERHTVVGKVLFQVQKSAAESQKVGVFIDRQRKLQQEGALARVFQDYEREACQNLGVDENELQEMKTMLNWPDLSKECKLNMDRHDLNKIWTIANRFECKDERLLPQRDTMQQITKKTLGELKKYIERTKT